MGTYDSGLVRRSPEFPGITVNGGSTPSVPIKYSRACGQVVNTIMIVVNGVGLLTQRARVRTSPCPFYFFNKAKNMKKQKELAATIDALRSRRGRQTGMVSLYVPPSARVSDIRARVRNEMVESENVKDKTNRSNVMSNLTAILS